MKCLLKEDVWKRKENSIITSMCFVENSELKLSIFRNLAPFPLGKCEKIEISFRWTIPTSLIFTAANLSLKTEYSYNDYSTLSKELKLLRVLKKRSKSTTERQGKKSDSRLLCERKSRNSLKCTRSNPRKNRIFKCGKFPSKKLQSMNSSLFNKLSHSSLLPESKRCECHREWQLLQNTFHFSVMRRRGLISLVTRPTLK